MSLKIQFPSENRWPLFLDFRRALFLLWITLKFVIYYLFQKITSFPSGNVNYGAQLRRSFEKMGLTYLKLGQFLALRFDILPKEVLVEMNNLFENVENLPFEKIKEQIERELQRPLEEVYPIFNQNPIGAATVAQVHEAVTFRNERVAIKVQRPGIERIFNADIRNLHRMAQLADLFKLGGAFVLVDVVVEFANWTRRELSFKQEAKTAERLRSTALPYEIIPKIFWDLSTDKIITMEFIDGLSLAKVIDLIEEGELEKIKEHFPDLDLKIIGRRIANAVLGQLFITGFFHGDPHPGNIFLCKNNTVAFLDFGIFGELNSEQLTILSGHLENIALGNISESFRYYAMQYQATEETDLKEFEKQGKEVLRKWYQASIDPYSNVDDKHLGKVGADMFDIIRKNKLRGSHSVLLFWRALYALDVSALKLAEYFDLMEEMKTFFVQFRPGSLERLMSMATDDNRNFAIGKLSREWMHYGQKIITNSLERDRLYPINSQRSPIVRRFFKKQSLSMINGVLILSGLSFITGLSSFISSPFYFVLLSLTIFYLLLIVIHSLIFSNSKKTV